MASDARNNKTIMMGKRTENCKCSREQFHVMWYKKGEVTHLAFYYPSIGQMLPRGDT